MNKIIPLVLSGGSESRLWPLPREKYPKQLLPLVGDNSMLQETVARLDGIADLANPLLVCNEEHRFAVAEQLRLLGKQGQAGYPCRLHEGTECGQLGRRFCSC